MDSCSLIDAVFRQEYTGLKTRDKLKIRDYSQHFEGTLRLSELKTIMFQYPLLYLKPFDGWLSANGSFQGLEWWSAYNKIKHDRIQEYPRATLRNTVLGLCGLHQVITQSKTFLNALVRHDVLCFGDWGKQFILNDLYNEENTLVTVLIKTSLFATPAGARRFPDEIQDITPYLFSYGNKLWRYLGRIY